MANKKYSQLQVRSQPLTRIHQDDKNRVDGLASELNILNFEALRIVLTAGFEAIENRTVDPERIKEELQPNKDVDYPEKPKRRVAA